MNFNITIIERMILEALAEGDKSLAELRVSTKLENTVLTNLLSTLVAKNLIRTSSASYQLKKDISDDAKLELYDETNIQTELQEITSACFRMRNDNSTLKLKKVYMNEKEEQMYNALLKNMDIFLENLQTKQGDIATKKIIFWGGANYEAITHNTMSY